MITPKSTKSKHRLRQQRRRAQPARPPRGGAVDVEELRDLVAKLQAGVCDNVIYFFDERVFVVITRENVEEVADFLDGESDELALPFSVLPDFSGEGVAQ